MEELIKNMFNSHREAVAVLEENKHLLLEIAENIYTSLQNNGKIIFFGNGGSAADAQHLAAEFVGRFNKVRAPLASIALTTNTSILTAIGNDFDFKEVFAFQIEALGRANDLVIAISTSGSSWNVIQGINKAKSIGLSTIAFLGKSGGILKEQADKVLLIPLQDTARVQEMHIFAGHIICELVEEMVVLNTT